MSRLRWRDRGRAAGAFAVAAALAACSAEPRDPDPPGAWWVGSRSAVRDVLGQLRQLEGTPVGASALQLEAVLPGCDLVGARAGTPDFAQLVLETRCVAPEDPLARELQRVGGEVAFALPVSPGSRVRGALRRDGETLVTELTWSRPEADGALALWLPGEGPAGPDRLGSAGRLAHVRMRPRDGIDLARWIPARERGSLAARLFALFDGLVLDGTWEGAAYHPERPGDAPDLALALGFRIKGPSVAAAERVLAEVREAWPVERRDLSLPAGDGACLSRLPGLPDLEPCYVATADALVFGWNPRSLRRALAPGGSVASDAAGRLDVDLAALGRAGLGEPGRLAASAQTPDWPWRRLRATGRIEDDVLTWRIALSLRGRGAS